MRTGLSTIHQTLTTDAATVLNHSIAEAGRRNHGQTTPLHVAATLLASPSGFLRQACIRSHPNSSHPLQCRALELCFSVALERLPTSQSTTLGMEPPISNALMAALKRAQAHQRRGCPEQQQQPLLAVKVELDQFIISILDDPSVSRVMREASFSSPAVKATIEHTLHSSARNVNPGSLATGFRPSPTPIPILSRNFCLNPRLQQGGPQVLQRDEEMKKIIDVLWRTKKKNPVLVGESEPGALVKELLRRIEKGEFSEGPLKDVKVLQLEKELLLDKMQIPSKIRGLGDLIESKSDGVNAVAILIDLGDLKWLVDQQKPVSFLASGGGLQQQQRQVASEMGREAVTEMKNLLEKFGENSNSSNAKLWLIATATCETYLRCQVYHPTMENDWDLHAISIASRSPLSGMFPRPAVNGIQSSLVDSMSPLKSFPTTATASPRRVSGNFDLASRMSCCQQCFQNYERELAQHEAEECEKSSSQENLEASRLTLPQWLENAKANDSYQSRTKDQVLILKQTSQDLLRKWSETCSRLHSNYQNLCSEPKSPMVSSIEYLYSPNVLPRKPHCPKVPRTGEILQLNSNRASSQSLELLSSSPASPVRTDLVLGRTKSTKTCSQNTQEEHEDFLGCISSQPWTNEDNKFASVLDSDSFKKLLKGLMEKAWWQAEAASAVTTTVTQCRLGNGKRRSGRSKGDVWLLFTGPDKVGKKKMASVLAGHVSGASPIIISLGSKHNEESDINLRGRTVLDRIAEAVRGNPFSVIVLEDIDEADLFIRASIKKAMERGRLADSHGRDISLGDVIFILTGNWSSIKGCGNGYLLDDLKATSVGSGGWQLELAVGTKNAKRRGNWLHDKNRLTRLKKEMGSSLFLDLNLSADAEDDRTDGSHNSSDLTIDHEDDPVSENSKFSITSVPQELVSSVDGTIVFKPMEFGAIRREIELTITKKFSSIVDDKVSFEVDDETLMKIVGGLWHGQSSLAEWTEKVLGPSFQKLKENISSTAIPALSEDTTVVRLTASCHLDGKANTDWLSDKIKVKKVDDVL